MRTRAIWGDARLPDRIWGKILPEPNSGCWLWMAALGRGGYGYTWFNDLMWRAHRLLFVTLIGPVADELVLDHRCRVTQCVNPDHLEPVTNRVNTLRGISPWAINARKTHCKRGHALTPDNIYARPKGARECLACKQYFSMDRVASRSDVEVLPDA